MSTSSPAPRAALPLDDLIALAEEMAALVRAGVPLERGLGGLGPLPGRLGPMAEQLAERLERGEELADVLSTDSRLPPLFGAVAQAGLRAGRLPAALEALAQSARQLAELRRAAGLALLYPLAVLLLAYFFSLVFLFQVAPALAASFEAFQAPASAVVERVARAKGWAASGWWAPPLVVLATAGFWWWRSGRSIGIDPAGVKRFFGWIPGVGRMSRHAQASAFANVLALLLEAGAPLPEALRLAGQAAGGRRFREAAARLSEAIERGEDGRALAGKLGFPPLLSWLVGVGPSPRSLVPALRELSESYHRRAVEQAELSRAFLPALLVLAIGGTAAIVQVLLLFIPWTWIMRELAA